MKVVFLDWFKTLSNSLFWDKISDKEKHDAIVTSCFNMNNHLINPWMRGKYTSEAIAKIVSKDTGINEKYIYDELIKSASNMEFSSPEIPKLIKKIKNNGLLVIIATDNMDTLTRWTVPSLKLNSLFDGVLSSWELNALKGDFTGKKSLFFDKFFQDNPSIKPQDCILTDDSEDKLESIKKYGIAYRKINSKEELIGELRGIA
ncbi:hypothetical protein A2115_02300 [Candidatus Woesebacteria bacterium GWA1_41_8]|jgi:FMN phosphatase YigB (HAD superfamily)|uniref:Haloacid dehalogenase n=1 Tax=Candidatus Woesebacteria bacterium GWA1_41_8 TaxID=1802471 RepID=A0A1F7WJQ7_9BACT|nr:MAG: hypothetical protein A2115_02300 [Candidatus Woesebacteria bacterium GWA1_41_8]